MKYVAKLAIKGNTYGISVPQIVRESLNLELGDELEVTVKKVKK